MLWATFSRIEQPVRNCGDQPVVRDQRLPVMKENGGTLETTRSYVRGEARMRGAFRPRSAAFTEEGAAPAAHTHATHVTLLNRKARRAPRSYI